MWHRIKINSNQVVHSTEKAMLLRAPNKSELAGHEYWVGKKLIRPGFEYGSLILSVADGMKFTLRRTSEKTRRVLSERTVSAEELAGLYRYAVLPESIESTMVEAEYFPGGPVVEEYTAKHKPAPLEVPEKVEPDASLVR